MKKLVNPLRLASGMVVMLTTFAALYSYAMFQGGFVSWFLFYSFLPFLFYASILFIYPLRLFTVERIMDKKIYETGDPLTVEIKITRRFPFPLNYLIIEDYLPSSLKTDNCKVMVFPLFKKCLSQTIMIDSLPRGEHVFNELKLTTSDFLGFIKKDLLVEVENRIVVYPKAYEVNLFALQTEHEEGSVTKGFNKKETVVPASIREYQPGDRFSWINWKMTARKNTPMTKEFDRHEDQQVLVLMDRSDKMNEDCFERIVQYTASLLNALYQSSIPTGLISIGSDIKSFPSTKSIEMKQQMFYHLATVKNDSITDYPNALEREVSLLPSRGTLLFVTDYMTSDLEYLLKRLAMRSFKLIVILITPENKEKANYQIGERIIVVSGLKDEMSAGVRTG
ncbi:DUF58 domain-containing protein [Bacillus sp. Marseille-P3661]|uniref:DUF58 domain-containing protein n=1 Tax=Bacillus sp. Marseille-P3661 TaxID=1936234 RepID=UPI000C82AE2C|nr:DUF58 domain-containing protein [Bacillus sp. Marseille-P3661]